MSPSITGNSDDEPLSLSGVLGVVVLPLLESCEEPLSLPEEGVLSVDDVLSVEFPPCSASLEEGVSSLSPLFEDCGPLAGP